MTSWISTSAKPLVPWCHLLYGDVPFHLLACPQNGTHGSNLQRSQKGISCTSGSKIISCPGLAQALHFLSWYATFPTKQSSTSFCFRVLCWPLTALFRIQNKVFFCIHMWVGCLPVLDLCSRAWSLHLYKDKTTGVHRQTSVKRAFWTGFLIILMPSLKEITFLV